MFYIGEQLLRRLVRASVDFCDPEQQGVSSTFPGWWDIPATPMESFGIQKIAILLLYTLNCHFQRLTDQPVPPPPPIVALLKEIRHPAGLRHTQQSSSNVSHHLESSI